MRWRRRPPQPPPDAEKKTPRLATLASDGWELRSGQAANSANPTTFYIPTLEERTTLRRGMAVKLIFDQEGVEEDGSVTVQGERMYALVSHPRGEGYMGLLTSKPQLLEPSDVYLRAAAEVYFEPEHVIDIDHPPEDFVRVMFSEPPTRTWPYYRD